MSLIRKIIVAISVFGLPVQALAQSHETSGILKLEYTDGREATVGLEAVNEVLRTVGVRVSTLALPEEALPILEISQTRALSAQETSQLMSHFELSRADLLAEIEAAGREPTVEHGGSLTTHEPGVSPYPKVYDMKAMDAETRSWVLSKFSPLHINHTPDGVGIDEVMTLVSGGPWIWFFELPGDVIGKLTLGYVGLEANAWRISYPGIRPHGGFLNPDYGLVVAYAHGPEEFIMYFNKNNLADSDLNGTNAWVDYSASTPRLLDAPLSPDE